MDATYTHTLTATRPRSSRQAFPARALIVARTFGRGIAEGARNDTLDRTFAPSSSAQFSALSRGQQNRLLDRGFRP